MKKEKNIQAFKIILVFILIVGVLKFSDVIINPNIISYEAINLFLIIGCPILLAITGVLFFSKFIMQLSVRKKIIYMIGVSIILMLYQIISFMNNFHSEVDVYLIFSVFIFMIIISLIKIYRNREQ